MLIPEPSVAEALRAVGLAQPEYEVLAHLQTDGGIDLLVKLPRRVSLTQLCRKGLQNSGADGQTESTMARRLRSGALQEKSGYGLRAEPGRRVS